MKLKKYLLISLLFTQTVTIAQTKDVVIENIIKELKGNHIPIERKKYITYQIS